MQGIPFNTQGVAGILVGIKTNTRRPIKELDGKNFDKTMAYKNGDGSFCAYFETPTGNETEAKTAVRIKVWAKYKIGEIVFVETEQGITCSDSSEPELMMVKVQPELLIKITGIKVERLQDISEVDCIKEGVFKKDVPSWGSRGGEYPPMPTQDWAYTVNNLIGSTDIFEIFKTQIWQPLPYPPKYQWSANPYVFAYEFEVA